METLRRNQDVPECHLAALGAHWVVRQMFERSEVHCCVMGSGRFSWSEHPDSSARTHSDKQEPPLFPDDSDGGGTLGPL